MGSQEPSERVAPDYTASDGLDAAKLVRIGGTVLDPWQSDILDDWLGRTPSGKWAAPSAGGSVPRQNGKSLLIQARSEAGMLLYNEQVVYTAHLQKTATETFEEMRDFFEGPKLRRHVAEIKTAIGREQIILKSGARIKFLARTRNGGRGQHGDLLIFDEAQELDETQQASFLPAISASLNPQTLYLGTPPDENADGTVFRRIRTGALDGSAKRTAWFEYSVKEIGDIHDPARWAAANPALGRRISDKFKSYVGSLLAATSNPETGENPVFGQLAQGSLSPHTEKMRMTATQFAAATGLTVTDVGVVNDANPTSSDAILAQSQTLVLLAQQLNTGNGDALRTIAQMAQAILRNVPPGALTEEERNVMPHFKNPAMPSVAVTADAAIKIATAREEFASTDTFLEMIGFDQADIRRIRAQEQRVRGQQVLMEMEDEDNDAGVGDVHPQAGEAE